MKKIKIVFIGDYSEKSTRDLLCAFCDRYADAYDVMVTGYNMDSLNNEPYRKQIKVNAMNSERYLLYKDTAEYVVCTSQMPRFIKGKSNQKLIYVLSDYNKSLFAGVIGDINTVFSSNKNVINAFRESFKHVETRYVGNDGDQENNARRIVAAMEIADNPAREPEDYMVVSFEDQDFKNHDSFAMHRLFEQVLEESQNNVILFSNVRSDIEFSARSPIDTTLRAKSFLKWFDGTILFTTENSRIMFYEFLAENDIKTRA